MDLRSDALFLAEIGLPPAKLDSPRIGLDVMFKNTTNCAQGFAILNPGAVHILNFSVSVFPQTSDAAILNSGVPMALKLRSGKKNEIMRMISIYQKISKSGATAVRAQSLILYAPPRDSIAIPASLMRGDFPRIYFLTTLAPNLTMGSRLPSFEM